MDCPMKRIALLILFIAVVQHSFAGNLIVLDAADARTVTVAGKTSDCTFDGCWDLTRYRAMKATVTNLSVNEYLQLNFILTNEKQHTMSELALSKVTGRSEGVFDKQCHLAPGSTETFLILLPGIAPHPEIASHLTLMKVSPYAQMEYKEYNADFSDIRRISVVGSKMSIGQSWRLDALEFMPGERRDVPGYMQLDSAAFFPFIDRYGQFKHRDWPGKIRSDADLASARKREEIDLAAHPGPSGWDRFGGWADGPDLGPSEHFRVQKVDGKWWLVDPDGHLFFSHGIVRVNPSCSVTPLHGKTMPSRRFMFEDLPSEGDSLYRFHFTNDKLLLPYYERWQEDSTFDFSSANIYRKYGPQYRQIWSELAHRRLRSWGMNTIANSSDADICHMSRTPYIDRFDVRSEPIAGAEGAWFPIMDPYDSSFRQAVEQNLRERQYEIDDPYNIGFFVDNEIRWGDATHAARCVVSAPETQAAKIRMREFLRERYGRPVEPSQASEADLKDFNAEIIDTYYRVIRESFDSLAPGVLYMGCRFAGFTFPNEDVVRIGARYCDVISHNQYRYTIDSYRLPEGVDKPVIVGEWHLGACDRGLFYHSLIECDSQMERAEFYYRYAVSAIKHPDIVGIHWHQFMDQATTGRFDGENMQVGFLDCCDTPYQETIEASRRAGYDMYSVRCMSGRDGARKGDIVLAADKCTAVNLQTRRIQKAIDRASRRGGGRVVLEGGVFLTGPIELKSGVELHIAEGTTLLGSGNLKDYPDRKKTRHFDTSCLPRWRNIALIYADEASDIAITGKGTIDCNGKVFVREKTEPGWTGWWYERIVAYDQSVPRAVFFAGCSDVTVTDVTMVNQPAGWSYWVHDCDRVRFSGCKILADVRYPNNDGIHVNCSRDVNISDCIIETGDDSIVLRANSRSLKENKPCERVTVTNCTLRSWSSAIRIGWTNDGVIRDCTVSNIVMHDCSNCISCFLPDMEIVENTNDYGREATFVENLVFDNIVMDHVYGCPVYVRVGDSGRTHFEAFRNVSFSNIVCHSLEKSFFNARSGGGAGVSWNNCTFVIDEPSSYPENPKRHGYVGLPRVKSPGDTVWPM